MMDWQNRINKLKAKAEKKGLTSYRIAKLSGMHLPQVYNFFAKKYEPRAKTFDRIEKVVNEYKMK
jgi:hypothetical protein